MKHWTKFPSQLLSYTKDEITYVFGINMFSVYCLLRNIFLIEIIAHYFYSAKVVTKMCTCGSFPPVCGGVCACAYVIVLLHMDIFCTIMGI